MAESENTNDTAAAAAACQQTMSVYKLSAMSDH